MKGLQHEMDMVRHDHIAMKNIFFTCPSHRTSRRGGRRVVLKNLPEVLPDTDSDKIAGAGHSQCGSLLCTRKRLEDLLW